MIIYCSLRIVVESSAWKAYEVPAAGLNAKGVAAVNLLQLQPEEKITAIIRHERCWRFWILVYGNQQGYRQENSTQRLRKYPDKRLNCHKT